eukprot:4365765-Pleurochrysis_carterae.AAC.2
MFLRSAVPSYVDEDRHAYVLAAAAPAVQADLKRRLGKGPPIWLEDKHALPLPEGDTHVVRVWFASNGKEYSAKLRGALEARHARSQQRQSCVRSRARLDARGAAGGFRTVTCGRVVWMGEARQQLWDDLRNFLLTSEKKEEDKKEEDEKEQNKKEEDKKEDKKEEDKEEEDKEEEDKKEEDNKEEDKKESADTAE